MADDLNTEIKIGADASGVEAGVGRAKRSLKDLGESAKKAGQDAGAGIGAIGAGGDKAAKDVERATKNIQGQLQRAIASFDAGEKGSRKFYESLARQRGADVAALKPLLDQLDAYKSKSEAAAQASAKVGTSFTGLSTAAGLAARAVAAIGITASVGEFVRMADASTNVASRLGLVTSSAAELASVQQRLFSIAQSSRVSFTDLVGTYAQVARSTKDLGVSQTALLGVIQTISQAVTISGGSAASAQAALVQLSQGFAAGALRGEELNSIMEQTPRLAQAIADGMGVSVGKLRELGQAGALTAEAVLGALEKSAAGVAAEFGKMAVTVEQASTNAANSVLRLVGASDRLLGVTSAIGGAIQTISNGLDFLSSDVEKLGNQGPLRAAAREVINLNAAAERLRTGMASGVLGPNAQGELDRINARLAEAKQRFRELDQQLSGGKDPRDQSGFTGRGVSYANEAARQAKLREDANAFRLNQAGVPASYLKDMAELIRLNQAGVIVGKEYTDALKAQQDLLLKKTTTVRGSAAAATQEQNAYESLISSIRAKIEADKLEIAGGTALTESQRLRIKLDQDLAAGRIKLGSAHEKSVRLALEELSASEAAALAAKTLSKANADAAQARERYLTSLASGVDKIKADTAAQIEATARLGLSKEAIADLDAAKLEMLATDLELQAIKAMDRNLDQQTYDALKAQAQAYRELGIAKKGGAAKEAALELEKANADAAKKAQEDWQRTAEKINDTLTDALMRGFESGKDFAKNMRDTVVNMFKTMVLRPVISAIVNPVAGSVTSALGLSGAQGGGNSIMGGIQTASNLNSLYGAGSQALFGGAAGASAASLGYANIVGMAGGDAIGALAAANGMWAGVATGAQAAAQAAIASNAAMAAGTAAALPAGTTAAAAGAGAGAGGASGALAAIPGWGWALAGVAALGMLAKKFDDSGTPHIGAGAIYSESGGLQEGASIYNGQNFGMGIAEEYAKGTQEGVSTIAKSLTQTFDGIAKAFGQTAGYEIATAFADDSSKDGAWGSLRISKDGADLLNWNDTRENKWAPREFANGEEGYKEYLAEIAKDTRTVLLDMDLPSWADTMLESIGEAASMDQLAATVQQIGVIQTTFVQLGKTMEGFAGLTDQAFEALMRASGGFESLAANAGTYYENFYSEAEKTAAVTRSVSDALAQVGVAMPATRDEFRALVESQLALGESGAEAVAALLGVSGAFASVTESAAAAQQRLEEERQQQLRLQESAAKSARDSAMRALETAVARERDAMDVQRSLAAESVDTLTGIFETIRGNVRELYGEVGSNAAMQVSQANAFIDQALRAAQTTGYMPDGAALSEAIGTARSGLSSGAYTSQFEADRDRLALAGKLTTLGEITGEQLTTAERQLKYSEEHIEQLDKTLNYWREQIDIANGTYQATLSVADAIGKLQALMFPDAQKPAAGKTPSGGGGASFGGGSGAAAAPSAPAKYNDLQFIGGDDPARQAVIDQERIAKLDALSPVYHSFDGTGDLTGLFAAIQAAGGTMADLSTLSGYWESDWRKAGASVGIPAFAVGTNYVPRDMLAQIHEGEAIVPKAYNPAANPGMGGGNSEVVSELRALREENRQQAGGIARLNLRMARMLEKFDGDGMPATRDEAVV